MDLSKAWFPLGVCSGAGLQGHMVVLSFIFRGTSVLFSIVAVPIYIPTNWAGGWWGSVTKLCPTLCDSMDCSTPGFPVLHYLLEFSQIHVHRVVMLSNHLILCHPLLLLPSIFPSIRVFSNESALCIRWSKDWSFSFSISLSREMFRTDFLWD